MRTLFLLMVVLGGCVVDSEAPPPLEIKSAGDVTVRAMNDASNDGPDVCALAAALPSDDICSLVCDPDAMKLQMIADGNSGGTCYQLVCSLTADQHVLVGVCLPP